MKKNEALKIYNAQNEKINAYYLALSTTSFDKDTIAPKKGTSYRNRMLSILYGEAFDAETDPKYIEAIKTLKEYDLGFEKNREIALTLKSLENTIKFTKQEAMEFDLAMMEATDAWEIAKHTNKYKKFEPHLQKLIEMSKLRAAKRNNKIKAYDLYLDDYEEGMDIKQYDEFFGLIKKELLPLIKEVNNNQDKVNDSFLYKYYPRAKQEQFMDELNKYLRFDKSWGYMGVSEHPFTNGFSQNDVRITTKYNEHNISSCIFSIIHEVGHAYYEHQVNTKYQETSIKKMISSGMHESQSRFFENYLGRRKSFWVKLYPKLQEIFPENLGDVSLDEFVRAINVSKSSLIRCDADELTYPIHILIRYEIEKDIFEGKLSDKDLNKVWNKKYKEYLGIDVDSDTNGILQDIHWSGASFGYFPTYALGSAIGAQLIHHIEKQFDLDEVLAKGKFNVITDYLKKNIQCYGALYDYNTILKMAVGEKFNPKYYINYLKKKFKKLYNIK